MKATIGVLLAATGLAMAQTTTIWNSGVINANVPAGSPVGAAFTTTLSGISGTNISDVTVSLNFLTPNDDSGSIYAYLVDPNGDQAVLLNLSGQQPGDSLTDQYGYQDGGYNVTFNDSSGYNNIHFYQNYSPGYNGNDQVLGAWASDGETQNPTSDSPTPPYGQGLGAANLTSMYGTDPNGTWTLYIADLTESTYPNDTLVSWGLTVVTAPEPQAITYAGIGLLGFLIVSHWKRKQF